MKVLAATIQFSQNNGKIKQFFESKKRYSLFRVRDVLFINAEVKLIKCFINDIPIDITGGQVGGMATLCFLEEVMFLLVIMLLNVNYCYNQVQQYNRGKTSTKTHNFIDKSLVLLWKQNTRIQPWINSYLCLNNLNALYIQQISHTNKNPFAG